MTAIIQLLSLMFLYSLIWFVPVTINYNRRKAGRSAYWSLFLSTLVLEIAVVIAVYYALGGGSQNIFLAYLPPLVASVLAGLFYIYLAKFLDKKYR